MHRVIVQEVERANNDEVFIVLTYQRKSIIHHLDNCEQLHFNYKNVKNNFFALYINQSLMKCFLKLNYSHAFLSGQQRRFSLLNNIIFEFFIIIKFSHLDLLIQTDRRLSLEYIKNY